MASLETRADVGACSEPTSLLRCRGLYPKARRETHCRSGHQRSQQVYCPPSPCSYLYTCIAERNNKFRVACFYSSELYVHLPVLFSSFCFFLSLISVFGSSCHKTMGLPVTVACCMRSCAHRTRAPEALTALHSRETRMRAEAEAAATRRQRSASSVALNRHRARLQLLSAARVHAANRGARRDRFATCTRENEGRSSR